MGRRLFLRDCQAGDVIEDVFMISNKQLGATNQGKPYIKAVLGDRSGQVNARWWNASKETFAAMPDTANASTPSASSHELCASIQNRHLSAIIQAYLDDESLMNNFCKAPAAMSFHHAFLGGLLEHTLNAMEVTG